MIYFLTEKRKNADFLIKKYEMKSVNYGPYQIYESETAVLGVSGADVLDAATLAGFLFSRFSVCDKDMFVYYAKCSSPLTFAIEHKMPGEKTIFTDILFKTEEVLAKNDNDRACYGAIYAASKFFSADRILAIFAPEEDSEKVLSLIENAENFQKENYEAAFDFTPEEEKKMADIAAEKRFSFQEREMLKIKTWKEKLL